MMRVHTHPVPFPQFEDGLEKCGFGQNPRACQGRVEVEVMGAVVNEFEKVLA